MTDWNARYEAGDTPWDKAAPAPPLLEIKERRGLADWSGLVLVPGCGRGHDVAWLAGQGLAVLGLDVAPLAVEQAREILAGTGARVESGDFMEAAPGKAGVIFEHTCFCAIDPDQRTNYVRAASRWLTEGGLLVAVFYLDPGNDGQGPPFGSTRGELDGLFNPGFILVDEWVPQIAFPGREGRELVRVYRKR